MRNRVPRARSAKREHRPGPADLSSEDEHPARAGKRPKLRPTSISINSSLTDSGPSTPLPIVPQRAGRLKKQARARPVSTHRMSTRSKTNHFRLLDLPQQLRNMIYQYVSSTAPISPMKLQHVTLPPLLSVSKTIRSEALSVFFASVNLEVEVCSNYCIRSSHWHGPEFIRYSIAGAVELPDSLLNFPHQAVRFRHVTFQITCVCCSPAVEIGSLTFQVEGGRVKGIQRTTRTEHKYAIKALDHLCGQAGRMAKLLSRRSGFNGFRFEDLEDIGMMFRHTMDEDDDDMWL